jgi:hypothetical protein
MLPLEAQRGEKFTRILTAQPSKNPRLTPHMGLQMKSGNIYIYINSFLILQFNLWRSINRKQNNFKLKDSQVTEWYIHVISLFQFLWQLCKQFFYSLSHIPGLQNILRQRHDIISEEITIITPFIHLAIKMWILEKPSQKKRGGKILDFVFHYSVRTN